MMKLRLALAQMRCQKGDWHGNLERAASYVADAASMGCDVIVFPEMALSGYCDPARYPDAPQSLDSPLVARFVELTKMYGIAASGGFIETNPAGDKPFITQVLAQGGRITGVYRKVNVAEDEVEWFSPGAETPVFTLYKPGGSVKCALAVCADTDRPDLFAAFARQGARVVFHSSAPGLYTRRTDETSWQAGHEWYKSYLFDRLPTYARANNLYVAVATQTGATVDEDFPGGSFVFGPDGTCLAGTNNFEETLLVHDLSLELPGGQKSKPSEPAQASDE